MKYYIGQVIVPQWEDLSRNTFIFKTEGDPNKHHMFKVFGYGHKVREIRKQTFLDLEATNILS